MLSHTQIQIVVAFLAQIKIHNITLLKEQHFFLLLNYIKASALEIFNFPFFV